MICMKRNKIIEDKKNNKNLDNVKKIKKNKNNSPSKIKITPEKKKNKKEDNHTDRSKNTIHDAYKSKDKEPKHLNPHKKHNHQLSHHTQYTHQPKMLRTSPIVFNTSKSKERSVSIKINTNRSHHAQKDKQGMKNLSRKLFKYNKENQKSKSNQKSKQKSKDKSRSKSRLKTDRDISPLKQAKTTKQFNVADREIKYNREQAQQLKKTLKKKMQKQKQKRKDEFYVYEYPRAEVQVVQQQRKVKLRKKVPQIKTQFSERRGSYFDQNLLKKIQINKYQQKISQKCPFNPIKYNFDDSKSSSQQMSSRSYSKLQAHKYPSYSHSQINQISEVELFKKQQQLKWIQLLEQLNSLKHDPHVEQKIDALIQQLNKNFVSLQGRTLQISNLSNRSSNSKQSPQKIQISKLQQNTKTKQQNQNDVELEDRFKKKFQIQHDDTYTNLYFPKITTNPHNKPSGEENIKNKSNQSSFKKLDIKQVPISHLATQKSKQNQDQIQVLQQNRDKQKRNQETYIQIQHNTDNVFLNSFLSNKAVIQQFDNSIPNQVQLKHSINQANINLQIESPVIINIQEDLKQFKRSNISQDFQHFRNKKQYALKQQFAASLQYKYPHPSQSIQIAQIQSQFDPNKQSDTCLLRELNANSQNTKNDYRKNEFIMQLQSKKLSQQFVEQMYENDNFYNEVNINGDQSSQSMLLNIAHGDNNRNQQIVSEIQHILIIQFCTNILRSRSILHNFLVTYSEMVDNNAINVDLVEEHSPVKLTYITNEQIVDLLHQLLKHIEANCKQAFMKQIKTSFVCKPIDILKFMRTNDQDQLYDKSSVFQSESEPQVPYFDIQKIEEFQTEVLKNQFFIPNYFSFNHSIYDCFNDIFQEMRPYGVRGKAMFSFEISTPYRDFKQVKEEIIRKFSSNLQQKYYNEKIDDDFSRNGQEGIFELIYFVSQQIMEQIFQSQRENVCNVINKRW